MSVEVEPKCGISTKPAATVPIIAPNAPTAYIEPSAYAELSRPRIAATVKIGAGIPARTDGRKKALMVMSEIATKGSDVFEIMGVAKSLSINPAHAVDIAANIITPPETLSAVVILDVAILPPIQFPIENPARTTAMIAVHVYKLIPTYGAIILPATISTTMLEAEITPCKIIKTKSGYNFS